MPRNSAIMKAEMPITGGIICPPQEETASMAAAKRGRMPASFIIGIVKEPVTSTLATVPPVIVPKRLDATTATLAGAPRDSPSKA